MAHKVRTDIEFADLDQYQLMKSQLDKAGIKFDTFVTYCVDLVWNQMLEEHKRQEAEEARYAISRHESSRDTAEASPSQGVDTQKPLSIEADTAQV